MMPLDNACLKTLATSKSIIKLDLGFCDFDLEVQ